MMRASLMLLVLAGAFAASPTTTSPIAAISPVGANDTQLDAARIKYANILREAILTTVSGMIDVVAGSGHNLSLSNVEWNATVDKDVGGTDALPPDFKDKLAQLIPAKAQQKAAFLSHVLGVVFRSNVPLDVAYAHVMNGNHAEYTDVFKNHGDQLKGFGKFVESGHGFGFGFQLFCGCKLIFTTGGGFGGGFTADAFVGTQGGLGGGGGSQAFVGGLEDEGKDDTPALNIGGGGGGSLTGSGASTDFGQLIPVASMQDAHSRLIGPQLKKCPSGMLSVVGGGGAGMGVTVSEGDTVTAYGGGLHLTFTSSEAAANDMKCGGKLLHDSSNNQGGSYSAISNATSACRSQCVSAKTKGLSEFWKCTCPCTKNAFQAMNLTFASKMLCQ